MPLPPGRPGPTVLARTARGGIADAFSLVAVRFLMEKVGELTRERIACMNWIAVAPQHRDWPYVPPDYELLFDVVTHDGVGFVHRCGSDEEPLPPVPDDDPLFAPIQPPVPISKIDLSMCGLLLFVGALREVVLVSNVRFEPAFLEQVGRHNAIVTGLGAPAERQMRLITFPWDPRQPDAWHQVAAAQGRAPAQPASASAPSKGAPAAVPAALPAAQASTPMQAALASMHAGNRLAEQGRLEEALRCHDEAIRLSPTLALAWSNKAYVLSGLGRMDESLAAAKRAVALDDKVIAAWINLANALLSLSLHPEALAACQRGLALDPRSPQLHYNAATAADRTYRQPLAVTHYRAFVEHATPAMQSLVERAKQRLRVLG